MNTFRRHIIIVILLAVTAASFAQTGFYVPKQGKVFFAGDTATVFSNVLNYGTLGVGKKAVLNFKGQLWQNDQQSIISDETNNGIGVAGQGGLINFSADNIRQKLVGGYNAAIQSGPMFSSLQIQNSLGVELDETSAKVWQQVILSKGLVYLNGEIFVVGHKQPGDIKGYDSSRFFVTGTQPNGGILLRENIRRADGLVVFPVGTNANAYTPAALQSRTSAGDNYYVSVFNGAKAGLFNGADLSAESVNKTWQIGKMMRPGEDETDVYLQHLDRDEGVKFSSNRSHAYISQFSATGWDEGFPQGTPAKGYLAQGGLAKSSVNSRTMHATVSDASYFIKLTGTRDTAAKTHLLLGAFRVNSTLVRVNWQTKPEINVKYFVVERRLDNEVNFIAVDTVASTAPNGLSFITLFYGINDANNYKGVSYYRLKVFDYNNSSYYSPTVAVNGTGFNPTILWPNPTPNRFNLIVNSPQAKLIVIFNVLGQKMWSMPINARVQTYVEVKDHGLIPGTYFVSVVDAEGTILDTAKLVIIGR